MLTQGELGERAGVSMYTVNHAERGRNVSPRTGRALAQALGVEPEELLEGADSPKGLALSQTPQAATGSEVEGGEGRYVSVIAALRSYFWDLRLRWKEPGSKPTPEQLRDALKLLGYLTEHGAFERPLTPREQSEVSFLFNAAYKLRPLVEEFTEDDEAIWLRPMVEEVFEGMEKISS
jgi:transcriptional regulator with XRE-family HTH domain